MIPVFGVFFYASLFKSALMFTPRLFDDSFVSIGHDPKKAIRQERFINALFGAWFALVWPIGIIAIAILTGFWKHGLRF